MFEKGRAKTGGRQKASVTSQRRSSKFVEQLRGSGFDYVKELADTLKGLRDLRKNATDQKKDPDAYAKAVELKFFYNELKSLLPFMAPRLREKEVEVSSEPETPPETPRGPISDEDLMKALDNGSKPEPLPRASDAPVLAAGTSGVQIPAGTEKDLSNLAGEQEEDS